MTSSRAKTAAVLAAVLLVITVGGCSKGSEKASGPATLLDATSVERSGAPVPSAGCATGSTSTSTPPVTGTITDTPVTIAGLSGHVLTQLPTSYNGSTPVPLVIDLHGLLETPQIQASMSEFPAVAEANGVAYVAPGVEAPVPWWDAEPNPTVRADMDFVRGVITQTEASACIDTSRVYAMGLSNGALMVSAMACSMSDVIVAIAPVAGLYYPADCHNSRPVPIIAFHGTDDQFIKYDTGGKGPAVDVLPVPPDLDGLINKFEPRPIPEAAQKWADSQQCASPATETQVSPQVKLLAYSGCSQGSTVELYVVQGGGHAWPGSAFSSQIASTVGMTTMEINASDLIWKFFSQYQMPPS